MKWKGVVYVMLTGTCPYFKSTWMICPCGCAAAQRAGIDIDDPSLVHPYWLIRNHPLWASVLQSVGLSDYPESPSPSTRASAVPVNDAKESDVCRITSDIYDNLEDMEYLVPAKRVVIFVNFLQNWRRLLVQAAGATRLQLRN